MEFEGKRVTLMGLGHFGGGVGAARWLAGQGALVTVTDLADEAQLSDSLDQLPRQAMAGLHLGGHHAGDFRRADLVVVNPAVRPNDPYAEIAARAGVPTTTEIELFLQRCPAPVIGVTGTIGKSTTAAMTAAILRSSGRRTWLGGNLGGSLLEQLGEIRSEDWVVLELSSFQLWYLGHQVPAPKIAVVTNCSPNHLDWHGDYQRYVRAKQEIITRQRSDDLSLLNPLDLQVRSWKTLAAGCSLPMAEDEDLPELQVPGDHNRINARLAATAARAAGCDDRAVEHGLKSFAGLAGRLELVAVIDGRRFYNDTASTTPESTVVALESMPGRIWLLAGGGDKGAEFGPLADATVRHAAGAAFFGKVVGRLMEEVRRRSNRFPCTGAETLEQSFGWCWQRSNPGDSILLSPACSSHDQFRNFLERGEAFMRLIRAFAEL